MGSWWSSEPEPTALEQEQKEGKQEAKEELPKEDWKLPSPIEVEKVLSEDSETQEKLCKYLFNNGYAIISLSSNTYKVILETARNMKTAIKDLFSDRQGYFAQPQDVKNLNLEKEGNNLGYVKVGNIREYIKLRTSDPDNLWPKTPSTMKENWTKVSKYLKDISWKAFLGVSQSSYAYKLKDPKILSAIEEFVEPKSSISLIHYFPVTNDDKQCVCSVHEDTGLLTIGVCSDIPGLIMWDRVKEGWVEIEKMMKPGDIILFVGQKIPLFSGSDKWKATTHKVEIPTGTERYSFVFLLDVAK